MGTNVFRKSLQYAGFLCCIAGLSCTAGALTGQTLSENRDLPSFQSISLAMAGELSLTQGTPQSVSIEADKDELPDIITEVRGNTLVIKRKDGHWSRMGNVKIRITVPEVNQLTVSGSGDITSLTPIRTADMAIEVSGSGNVNIGTLQASSVSVRITGSGNVTLAGNNDQSRLEATVTGSGNFKAENLSVADAEIHVTGSGSVRVNALKNLETNITGSGNVHYRGNPTVNAHSTGSGKTVSL